MSRFTDRADEAAIDAVALNVQRGDFDAARAACERFFAVVADPARQAPLRFWMGVIEQRAGALPAAITQFERALQTNRRHAPWLRQAAAAHFELNALDRAEYLYREALRFDRRDAMSHYNLGVLLQRKHDWHGARRAFEVALTHRPQFAEALINLANTLIELADLARVEACYRRALEVNPREALAHHGLGLYLFRVGKTAEAGRCFASAVECNPGHVDAWLDLAECHHVAGDNVSANAAVEHVLSIASTDSPAHESAQFKLAQYRGDQPKGVPHTIVMRLYEGMAGTFDTHLTERLGYCIPKMLISELGEWLNTFPTRNLRQPVIADLGCGTGLFGIEVRRFAARLVGVDLSAAMLKRARDRGCYDALIENDLLSFLDDAKEVFDLIVATDVFIYVGRLDELFARMTLRLSSGGRFAFSTESLRALDADYHLQPSGRFAHQPRYIARLAAEYELEVVKQVDCDIRTENGVPLAGQMHILEAAARA